MAYGSESFEECLDFRERALHTRRKGLQNKIEERAEESDKAAVRRERFVWQCILKCEILIKRRNEKYQ